MNSKVSEALKEIDMTYDSLIELADNIYQDVTGDIDNLVSSIRDGVEGLSNDSIRTLMLRLSISSYRLSEIKEKSAFKASLGQAIREEAYAHNFSANMGEQDKLNELLTKKMQELDERERTINQLQDMMTSLNDKVQNILKGVKEALMGFSSDELSVREENGKIHTAQLYQLLINSSSRKKNQPVASNETASKKFILEDIMKFSKSDSADLKKSADLLLESCLFRWFGKQNKTEGKIAAQKKSKSAKSYVEHSKKTI